MNYCYIANELYPRDKGGIARLIHNIVHHQHSTEADCRITIVLPAAPLAERESLIRDYESIAHIAFVRPWHEQHWDFQKPSNSGNSLPFQDAFFDGLGIIDALLHAEKLSSPFDIIEVTDHGGLGAFVLRMRDSGYAFQQAKILCRLHSSFSIIAAHEPFEHARGAWAATRLDLERETVVNADYCIAHLESVADANQSHFMLDDEWRKKVIVAFPACLQLNADFANESSAKLQEPTFVFSSRFQAFKRPELFILGALAFLHAHPESNAKFRLISYAFDPLYIDRLRLMIPQALRGRIIIHTNATQQERIDAIITGIVVQPSSFESLCVFAYEVSALKRPILLPRDCVAFAQEPRWIDGENCLMFDPTPEGLAKVMERALTWQPSATVVTTKNKLLLPSRDESRLNPTPVALSIGVLPATGGLDPATLELMASLGLEFQAFAPADQLQDDSSARLQYITNIPAYQYAGAFLLNWTLNSRSECIVLTANGYLPTPAFLSMAQTAIRPGHVLSSNCIAEVETHSEIEVFAGKSPHISLGTAPLIPPCFAVHISDLETLVDSADNQDILTRALARLVASPLKLTIAPQPMIKRLVPPYEWSRRRNIMAFGQLPADGSHQIQRLGIDLPNSTLEFTLNVTPAKWELRDNEGMEVTERAFSLSASPDPQAFLLTIDASNLRRIIGVGISLSPAVPVPVNISFHLGHNKAEALAAHGKGQQRRKVSPGQKFQLRWGPFEGNLESFTLIVDAENAAQLDISEIKVLTRE